MTEVVDRNGVWVLAEPGILYDTQLEAAEAAETLGNFIGVDKPTTQLERQP